MSTDVDIRERLHRFVVRSVAIIVPLRAGDSALPVVMAER